MQVMVVNVGTEFQSTLPRGSDVVSFNADSSTKRFQSTLPRGSDHSVCAVLGCGGDFNPRSLAGATIAHSHESLPLGFQSTLPRGSDKLCSVSTLNTASFQSTLPRGSDSIKTNYFSIHLNQAFFANRLNSNTQEFYFDVRNLIVSHSSLSCEPKLNFMSHITSHRINLHYFSSCQSICK